jgi:hypothetical protein
MQYILRIFLFTDVFQIHTDCEIPSSSMNWHIYPQPILVLIYDARFVLSFLSGNHVEEREALDWRDRCVINGIFTTMFFLVPYYAMTHLPRRGPRPASLWSIVIMTTIEDPKYNSILSCEDN